MNVSMDLTVIACYALLRAIPSLLEGWTNVQAERHRADDEVAAPTPVLTPRPMYPKHVPSLPIGDEWSYEVKFRGRRALAVKERNRVVLYSAGCSLQVDALRDIRRALGGLDAETAVLDGQLVPITPWHRAWWPDLARHSVIYAVFDLLRVNDDVWLERPLTERRAALSALPLRGPAVQLRPVPATAEEVIALLRKLGFDAIAKRRDSPYEPGVRSDHWRLMKIPPANDAIGVSTTAVEIARELPIGV
jgi:bifunctional non-homologous end joining protein LigD